MHGWGRGLRRAVGAWYAAAPVEALAFQAIKFRARQGWTHRDLLRLAHPEMAEPARRALFDWICRGRLVEEVPMIVHAFAQMQAEGIDGAVAATADLPFGATDCSLPMRWALERGIEADAFVVYTDSETWAGPVHPVQALREYREKTGIRAKLVVVGLVSSGFSIADPADPGMLDVVGFDAAAPAVIADFLRG
ncbi:TROVE domain-containing protein [Methylobacterium sp. ap11]|nr:TROVE domain-containing protein [Methylobacterium sp. ap11]